jgi:TM2 domain-containing membrane protein YozV
MARKDKTTAGVLGILLGGLGAHKFYLGDGGKGVLYLIFCWTYIPALIGIFEGIKYLSMDEKKFHRKYSESLPDNTTSQRQLPDHSPSPPSTSQDSGDQIAQNVTVELSGDQGGGSSSSTDDQLGVAEELEKLNKLREDGAISDEEFERQKEKLLG